MINNIQEHIISLLTLLLVIIPIIKEWIDKKKSANKTYILLIIIIFIFLLSLEINTVNINNRNSVFTENKIDTLLKQKKDDSLRFKRFEISLLNKFQITRDSNTNEPIKIYNTSIQNARTVNIGQD